MPPRKAATTAKADASTSAAPKKAAASKGAAVAKTTSKTATSTKKAAPAKAAPAKAAPAKAAPAKAATKKVTTKKESAKVNGTKRKAEDEVEEDQPKSASPEEDRPVKKARTIAAPKRRAAVGAPTIAAPKLGKPINKIPTDKLDIFVFGEGTSGELGLGSKKYDGKKPIDVKRPRINHNLDASKVGVVQMACGGMHAIALTHDNRLLTWGVNDDRALGRDTTWEGGTRDLDEDSDSDDDDDTGMNPNESTPGPVDMSAFPEGTKIAQVIATDSASFVLTEDGSVYGWGTFRGADGIIGFSEKVRTQPTPVKIEELKKIVRLASGANHVLALDEDGKVFTWGSGGQYQLGRKPISRHDGVKAGLKPEPCGKFTKRLHATAIAAGNYHSFYKDNQGRIWSWGLNNYSQTGHNDDQGKDDAMVLTPKVVESLKDKDIVAITGGEHHSLAVTSGGALLTWGRVDGHQVGQPSEIFTEDNTIYDEFGKPRILAEPTATKVTDAKFIVTGTDTSFAIDNAGKVYSWGFSANYQTGQGTGDDIEVPTLIDNTAVRGRKLIWAGSGGQYSALAAIHGDNLSNGH
ncbi:regulator of chromosome condensation 1/beta-lactamase-inhibitor protein II [Xylariales sp. PMI_506]|nr:regulator of chromosome condensation 1/beta-lactamase-inhibitor protein II [Xylariales sp. PMI_506]